MRYQILRGADNRPIALFRFDGVEAQSLQDGGMWVFSPTAMDHFIGDEIGGDEITPAMAHTIAVGFGFPKAVPLDKG